MAAYGKKAQTEKKAKGLTKKVGDYKGKTLNLTKKQLGKKGTAAAQKRTVDISQTKYEGRKVLGPGGKALTGTVDLGGGNMAVYKNGVRVRAAAKKSPTIKTSTKTVSKKTSANASLSSAQKAKLIKDKKIASQMGTSKNSTRGSSAAGARYSGMAKAGSSASAPASTGGTKKKNWWEPGGGGFVGPNSPLRNNGSSKPKKGDRRPRGAYGGYETYNGTRWVKD